MRPGPTWWAVARLALALQVVLAPPLAPLVSCVVQADSILEFDLWMQSIDRHTQAALRTLAADPVAARGHARALISLYQQMEDFYTRRGNAEDAVLASYADKEHARRALELLDQQQPALARAEVVEIAQDCRGCHATFKPIRN